MAAYSAVACFRQTLQQLLDSDQFPDEFPKPETQNLHENISILQSSLDSLTFVPKRWRYTMHKLQDKMREAIYDAQDKSEYSIKDHFSPEKSEKKTSKDIVDKIDAITKEAAATTEKIISDTEAQNLFSEYPQPANNNFSGKDTIFGQKTDVRRISEELNSQDRQRLVIPITGLPGIGKTTLARSIYDNQDLVAQFHIRAWVTVSQDFSYQEIFYKILSSMESKNYKEGHYAKQGDEQTLRTHLHQELYNLKYLIVVDDVWKSSVWDRVMLALPDKEKGSRVLLTSRFPYVARSIQKDGYVHTMVPLTPEKSWKFLCYKVFEDEEEACPPHLREIGQRIAKKCKGLPLSLTVVGGLLFQERAKIDFWQRILEDVGDAAAKGGDKTYLEILSLREKPEYKTLKEIVEKIEAITKEVVKTLKEINTSPEAQNLFSENAHPAKFNFSGMDTIVGQEEDFQRIRDELLTEYKQRLVIPITGMPGIGKTTLARNIYENQGIAAQFNIRAWVTVSQDCTDQEIISRILSTMESKNYKEGHYAKKDDEKTLVTHLHQELYNLKYLIVLDDVWESSVWDKVVQALPDKKNGSRVLLTTRNSTVAESIQKSGYIHTMKPLSLDNSWKLLCCKVFGDTDESCPLHLWDTGQIIAEKCRGHPLAIAVIGGLLFQERERKKYWERIEEDVSEASLIGGEEIVSLNYSYLPEKLKGCFLYMGAFPKDSEIRVSRLIKLWVAEGFLTLPQESPPNQTLETVAQSNLEDLIRRNLISIRKRSSNGGIKVCGMHDTLRELAEYESRREKFFHSIKRYAQKQETDVQNQRRVSVHRNILMCVKNIYNSTQSIRGARSLLYVGPHHHHPLSFCLTFDLLRVLDAFTVYFIDFPHEFLKLIHLRYLSLTYNDDIPPQISRLQKLQVLMVRREPKIIFVGVSFLPDEIWDMPQLRHLWFTETDFPALPSQVADNRVVLLLNLQTLSNVNAAFFTDDVLDNMPNLRKLSMWIESPAKIEFNLDKLSQLEIFKFIVLNPIDEAGKGIQIDPKRFFPKTLKRLNLSGCGLPWEYMKNVAELPDLEVLKLRELAFNGEEWRLNYKFKNLKYLLIEYLNFIEWEAKDTQFPILESLILRHCFKLEDIPLEFVFIEPLKLIELVDCSPNAERSAGKIVKKLKECGQNTTEVRVFSSWE